MSLRLRAVLITALALVLLWAAVAGWLMLGVRSQLQHTLDNRLAMSARMVAGLLQRNDLQQLVPSAPSQERLALSPVEGIACEIRTARGDLVAGTDNLPDAPMEHLPAGYNTRTLDGTVWRIYVLQDARGHRITTADRMADRRVLTTSLLRAAGVPFLVAMLGGLLALWLGITRGLAPLKILRHQLQRRRADDTTAINTRCTPPELLPLVAALNGLLGRLAIALASQRAFTDAAAHELRSPLTVIDTHLQVALLADDAPVASLESARQGVRRLRHTLEQMMALARTDAATIKEAHCPSVSDAVIEVMEQFPATQRARLHMTRTGPDTGCSVPTSLLLTALHNLVDNALRYSPQQQRVDLHLLLEGQNGHCRVDIADRGPGLSPQQRSKIGQRFWRGDIGRAQQDGSGLGVSIVDAIARRFGGRLTLSARPGGGLVARLDLPVSPDSFA